MIITPKYIVMIAILVSAVLFVWFFSRKQLLQRIAQLELDKKTANSNYLILLEEYMKKTSSIPQAGKNAEIDHLISLENDHPFSHQIDHPFLLQTDHPLAGR